MEVFDAKYEFDAPLWRDFRRDSSGSQAADLWFDHQHGTPAEKRPVLAEVVNRLHGLAAQAAQQTAGKLDAVPSTIKKSNIVTSWGTASNSKATAQKQQQQRTAQKPAQNEGDKPNAASVPSAEAQPAGCPTSTQPIPTPAPEIVAAGPAEGAAAPCAAPEPRRMTRGAAKKQLEAAALQSATVKANKQRVLHHRSVKAALDTARRNSTKQASCTKASASGTAGVRAKAAAARTARPTSRLVGGVTKPARAAPPQRAAAARSGSSTANVTAARDTKRVGSKPAATVKPKVTVKPRFTSTAARLGGTAVWAGRLRSTGVAGTAVQETRTQRTQAHAGPSRAQDRLRLALQPAKVVARRSTRPLTLPEEPHLQTTRRVRKATDDTAVAGGAHTPFKALAAKVMEFQRKTPARFRSKPTPADPPKPLVLTHAIEPQLYTAARARPSTLKPRDVEEEEAMAAMPPFHALPLRNEILKEGSHGPAKPEPRAPTEPVPFNFVTDDRAARRQHHPCAAEQGQDGKDALGEVPQFKARPLKPSILEAPDHLPKKARMSLTVPVSPLLATKARAHEQAKFEPERHEFKARPVPAFLHVPGEMQPSSLPARDLTEPQPFNLRTEQRGAQHQSKLQARLAEEQAVEEQAKHMKALPLPTAVMEGPVVPPRPEPKPLTVPEPFTLQSLVRHEVSVAEFQGHVAMEVANARAEAQFKARPMWQGIPYQLHPSDAPLTVPDHMQLATETRAADRSEFDAAVQEKIRLAEMEKAAAAEAAARQEEEATKEYRRSLRFKAQPMPKFGKVFAPVPSSKALTKPKTPQFGRKRKADAE